MPDNVGFLTLGLSSKALLCLFLFSSMAFSQKEVIKLYSGTVPGLKPGMEKTVEENTIGTDGVLRVRSVTVPELTIYRPSKGKGKRASVIICPGGGYYILALNKEGHAIGEWFAKNGITAFVLKYRLPQEDLFEDKQIRPLQDIQQAFRIVRGRASDFGIDPARIGVMGFSAGGHLAATASTHFDEQVGEIQEQALSVRPDFSILMYPVISFNDKYGHTGSRTNLIGPDIEIKDQEYFSNELQVKSDTPPAFLVHAIDDPVRMENSLSYVEALKKKGISAELHLYDTGGHGFGLALDKKSPVASWSDRLKEWLKWHDLL